MHGGKALLHPEPAEAKNGSALKITAQKIFRNCKEATGRHGNVLILALCLTQYPKAASCHVSAGPVSITTTHIWHLITPASLQCISTSKTPLQDLPRLLGLSNRDEPPLLPSSELRRKSWIGRLSFPICKDKPTQGGLAACPKWDQLRQI